jgi:hypothetical protein
LILDPSCAGHFTKRLQNTLLRQKRQQTFFAAEEFPQMSGKASIKNLIFAANNCVTIRWQNVPQERAIACISCGIKSFRVLQGS